MDLGNLVKAFTEPVNCLGMLGAQSVEALATAAVTIGNASAGFVTCVVQNLQSLA